MKNSKTSITILFFFMIILQSCKNTNEKKVIENSMNSFFEISENWKQDLLLNKKVYSVENEKKAIEDYESKKSAYPVGLPSYIDASFDDINFDKKNDALFYFYPIDILHGTGMIDQSDYSLLICTNGKEYEVIKDFTEVIKSKIKSNYKDHRCYKVKLEFEGLREGLVVGNYSAWVNEDAHCCPTFKGEFSYDYLRKAVKLTSESFDF